tara:strand:- start:1327 stop:2127 length:801 start_codon:yes stop_codon:yes gene_type:complete
MASAIKNRNWSQIITEILIVVIGIFIGLQVDDWNSERKKKAEGEEYLERLYQDLKFDADHFAQIKLDVGTKQYSLKSVENIVNTGDLDWSGNITFSIIGENTVGARQEANIDLFGALEYSTVYGWSFPNVRTTTFVDLQNSGNLAIIDNNDLRYAISFYYEESLNAYTRILARSTGYAQMAYKIIDGGARTSFGHANQDDMTIYDQADFDLKVSATDFLDRAQEEVFQELLRAEKNYSGFLIQMIKEQQTRTQTLISQIDKARSQS